MQRRIVIITGPTAIGKTDISIRLALRYGSPVISCDSRQIYREMSIGTAVPDASQLAAVRHYFIHTVSVTEPYSAGQYEIDALSLADHLFREGHETLIMSGGSGFYIEAVCHGLDNLPVPDPELRAGLSRRMKTEGTAALADELKVLDPKAWESIDIRNGQRVVRALETVLTSGRSFTEFRLAEPAGRNFTIEKICLVRPKEEIYSRIDRRVLKMIGDGLVDEVRNLLPYRDLPSLQTVGYREMFSYLDGSSSKDEAIRLIQRNTRHYAKKQITWWKRDPEVHWLDVSGKSAEQAADEISTLIESRTENL